MDEPEVGDIVVVVDAKGTRRRKRALSPVMQGGSFMVVWAYREEQWQAARAEGRDPVASSPDRGQAGLEDKSFTFWLERRRNRDRESGDCWCEELRAVAS